MVKYLIKTNNPEGCHKLTDRLGELGIIVETVSDTNQVQIPSNGMQATLALLIYEQIPESVDRDIRKLKELFPEIRIIVSTTANTKSKEAQVRREGIYYYHIGGPAGDELLAAVLSALGFGNKVHHNNFLLHTL